ncbi:MAG: APC family permease [Pirellulaceae bacterium]|nr:APC family permease [Pirellulaceae bacterium]
MSSSSTEQPALQRQVGLVALTLIAAGGILGSGWLFSPLLTAQLAGPASIISWAIGAVAMLLVAFCFAEVSSVLPVAGGIARIPRYTHGDITAAVIGWTAWVGYCTAAPIEVAVVMRYASQTWPDLVAHVDGAAVGQSGDASLSVLGFGIAGFLLTIFILINAIGAAAFARANSAITWLKFAVPVLVAITFIVSRFDTGNFSQTAGFAPYGLHGILSAVSTGGIVFALIGFRHALDMAGETRNPSRNVPLALIFGLLLPLFIYLLLQIAFIGALDPSELENGWVKVEASHGLGPLAAISATLGISWLTAVIYGGALIGPAGGALVATGSNARLAFALSRNQFLPAMFERLTRRGIPLNAMILNFLLGFLLLTLLEFKSIVAINSAAIVLSFSIGPVAVISLRRHMPNAEKRFHIPFPRLIATLGFTVSALIVYWSGWTSIVLLLLIVVASVVTLVCKRLLIEKKPWSSLDIRESLWLIPFLGSLTLLSRLGNFGGTGAIPFGWDLLLLVLLTMVNFLIAIWCSLDNKKAELYREAHKPIGGLDKDIPP